jgi:polyferredoxin
MRDMADPTTNPSPSPPSATRRVARWRPWVQAAFLGIWLGPFGLRLHSIPACVFHCYACPLASFACPVGVAAQFSALHLVPLLALGVVVTVAVLVGAVVCGWACPFGFLQDLLAKVPLPKFRIPSWMGYGRYLVLIALVVLVPYLWGEAHALFICRVCPVGALEAAVPAMARQAAGGNPVQWMSTAKGVILIAFLLAAVLTFRPWCAVLCPLGGFLALFNRGSLLRLRFDPERCTECNLCRSRCSMGVKVDVNVNDPRCIRCLECTTCGAIRLSTALRTERPATGSTP